MRVKWPALYSGKRLLSIQSRARCRTLAIAGSYALTLLVSGGGAHAQWLGKAIGGAAGGFAEAARMQHESNLAEQRERAAIEAHYRRLQEQAQAQVQQEAARRSDAAVARIISDQRALISEQRELLVRRDARISALEVENTRLRDELQNALVSVKHPGWEATVRSAVFGKWLDAQPLQVKALADSDRVEDAIALLDAYEDDTKQRRKRAQR